MSDRRSVSREIAAGADAVFALLASPAQHHRFDGSAMVGEAVTSDRLASVGDVFVMQMSYREGEQVEHYRTDNHVTAFEESAHLEWAVAPAGEAVLGWRWRYDVEPLPSGSTRVTLTYDWSDTPAENRRRFGVPLFDETQLAASLDLLATAVAAAHGVGGGF